jgi:hypothetical protein
LAFSLLNIGIDYDEYNDLENKNVAIIKKEDLPSEFGDNAYRTIVEFIQKTKFLDYEWAIFFDYTTGEILKCAKGMINKVKIDFEEGEFEGRHIASIHNHPAIDSFSPPSGKNFNILCRAFEDYELVVGRGELWVLKAKRILEPPLLLRRRGFANLKKNICVFLGDFYCTVVPTISNPLWRMFLLALMSLS